MWPSIKPFTSKAEQQECRLHYTNLANLSPFTPLDQYGEYSIEFIGNVIELMMIQEKTGHHAAFMFKGVLDAIYNDKDIFSIVSQAGHRGK